MFCAARSFFILYRCLFLGKLSKLIGIFNIVLVLSFFFFVKLRSGGQFFGTSPV